MLRSIVSYIISDCTLLPVLDAINILIYVGLSYVLRKLSKLEQLFY